MGIDQKIKVCHLVSGDLWAGAEVQVYSLLTSLKTDRHITVSIIILNEGKLADFLKEAGLEVTVIQESKYSFFKILKIIEEKLKDNEIDILHTHRYKENVLGALLKRKRVTKHLVQTVHGVREPFKGVKRLKIGVYSRMNEYFTRKYFDKVLAVSLDIEGKLARKMDTGKLITIHNSVDISNLQPTKSATEMRRELTIREEERVVGSVGRMVPIKGYEIFLEAARISLNEIPTARFLLVGDGPLKAELQNKAQDIGIENKVTFLGFRDDVLDILNILDIFVISSYHEGIPTALLEAMALERAVVATEVGGINEIIEDNVSGLMVKPGDPQALASACVKILKRPYSKKVLGNAAKKRIEEEFSIEVQKERVLKLYHEIASLP